MAGGRPSVKDPDDAPWEWGPRAQGCDIEDGDLDAHLWLLSSETPHPEGLMVFSSDK